MDYFSFDFVRYGVYSSLSPIELEKHSTQEDSPCFKTLNDPEFLTILSEKWNLKSCKSFEEFMLTWLRENIFSSDIPLEYILENYKRVFSTSKAVRVATRVKRDDFCDYLLEKYPHNEPLIECIIIGGLERPEILAKYKSDLSSQSVLRKACRLRMTRFVLTHGRGTKYYTMAAIIARERVVLFNKISILDIAALLKDVSVLTDPYYLDHPDVSTDFDRRKIVSTQSVFLYRHFGITSDELCSGSYYECNTKKLCKYHDEAGFDNWRFVYPVDVESLEWIVAKAKEDNVSLLCKSRDEHYKIHEDNSNEKYCLVVYYQNSTSIDMREWFERKIANP